MRRSTHEVIDDLRFPLRFDALPRQNPRDRCILLILGVHLRRDDSHDRLVFVLLECSSRKRGDVFCSKSFRRFPRSCRLCYRSKTLLLDLRACVRCHRDTALALRRELRVPALLRCCDLFRKRRRYLRAALSLARADSRVAGLTLRALGLLLREEFGVRVAVRGTPAGLERGRKFVRLAVLDALPEVSQRLNLVTLPLKILVSCAEHEQALREAGRLRLRVQRKRGLLSCRDARSTLRLLPLSQTDERVWPRSRTSRRCGLPCSAQGRLRLVRRAHGGARTHRRCSLLHVEELGRRYCEHARSGAAGVRRCCTER